jgi:hypothetical protein
MYLRHIVMEKMLSLIDVPKAANRSIAAADVLTLMRPLIDVVREREEGESTNCRSEPRPLFSDVCARNAEGPFYAALSKSRAGSLPRSRYTDTNVGALTTERMRRAKLAALCLIGSSRKAIPMTWWLASYDHSHRLFTLVHGLMLLTWRNLQSLTRKKKVVTVLHFHRQFSYEHEKELPSFGVDVTLFMGSRWHQFFDNAQIGRLDQMPAIAIGPMRTAPLIVFRGFFTCDLCRHESSWESF